jgi:hypothetical protein
MALVAGFIGNRRMDIIKQYSPPVRTMGVMAGRTVRLRHGIIHMLFRKVRPIRLMAAQAESDHIILQEMIGFGRGMWVMTVDASFLHWIMLKFSLCNRLSDIFMAANTEFIACLKENKLII